MEHVVRDPLMVNLLFKRATNKCSEQYCGSIGSPQVTPLAPVVVNDLSCHLCNKICQNHKSLQCHLAGFHKEKNPLRKRILGTLCQSCGTEFHTRHRLLSHLAYNASVCRYYYLNYVECVPDEVCETLEKESSLLTHALRKKGLNAGYHTMPSFRVPFARPFNPLVDETPVTGR